MSQNLRSVTELVRRIPLDVVLTYNDVRPRKEGNFTTRFKNKRLNIVVTGEDLWFDNDASIGGRGPIDLALHLHLGVSPKNPSAKQFREAVLWLYELRGGPNQVFSPTGTSSALSSGPVAPQNFEQQSATLAIREDMRWPLVRSYLVDVRRLPGRMVDDLYESGDLYPSFSEKHPQATAACFIHRDLDGVPRGATLRSTNPNSAFQQSIGAKAGAWFRIGNIGASSAMIVTEAPIDAVSYTAMYRPEGVSVLSMGCCHVFPRLIEVAQERGQQLVVALDNAPEADEAFRKCVEYQRLHFPNGEPPTRHAPLRKDWNDDLRFALPTSRGAHL